MSNLTGRCACGDVTYRITEDPLFTQVCHCLDCQRTTGSGFVVHTIIPLAALDIVGETVKSELDTGSGAGADIHACKRCQTYIWIRYKYHDVPVIAVRAGTLDDPTAVTPGAHIFTKRKLPWITINDGTPQAGELNNRDDVWPQKSLDRYAALLS